MRTGDFVYSDDGLARVHAIRAAPADEPDEAAIGVRLARPARSPTAS